MSRRANIINAFWAALYMMVYAPIVFTLSYILDILELKIGPWIDRKAWG